MTVVLAGTPLSEREIDRLMRHYEGLVMRTAQLLASGEHPDLHGSGPVEQDEDDVRQILRVKVYRAILAFDPTKVRARQADGRQRYGSISAADKARDRYVNMCVRDQAKDVAKKKRRGELMIEDVAPVIGDDGPRDSFEQRYLSTDHDAAYASVEDEFPTLPNTLSERERAVLALLYRDYRQIEIAGELDITKREVESAVRGIRTKLADWRPSSPAPRTAAFTLPA